MTESKELTAQEKFEQKLYSRLRDDIGELLPDEVLSEMAHRAIEKMFFEPLTYKKQQYGAWETKKKKYSWFEEKVEMLLRERLDKMAKKWIKDNADFLVKQFVTVMSAKMPELIAAAIFKPVDTAIMNMEDQLKTQISDYMQQQLQNPQSLVPLV